MTEAKYGRGNNYEALYIPDKSLHTMRAFCSAPQVALMMCDKNTSIWCIFSKKAVAYLPHRQPLLLLLSRSCYCLPLLSKSTCLISAESPCCELGLPSSSLMYDIASSSPCTFLRIRRPRGSTIMLPSSFQNRPQDCLQSYTDALKSFIDWISYAWCSVN